MQSNLRTSASSQQRQILATRHLWEAYLDDYRDFIMYLQAVALLKRPLDLAFGCICLHIILWNVLGSASVIGVLSILLLVFLVSTWFLDTVQARIPWRQLIPKTQRGQLVGQRSMQASRSTPELAAAGHDELLRKALQHSAQLVVDRVDQVCVNTASDTFFAKARVRYERILAFYLSFLPNVQPKTFQDIVLQLVLVKIGFSQWVKAVLLLRKENPDQFTLRAALLLLLFFFLGNSLGSFTIVYFGTFSLLFLPTCLLYNLHTRLHKAVLKLASTFIGLIRIRYSDRSVAVNIQRSTCPKPGSPEDDVQEEQQDRPTGDLMGNGTDLPAKRSMLFAEHHGLHAELNHSQIHEGITNANGVDSEQTGHRVILPGQSIMPPILSTELIHNAVAVSALKPLPTQSDSKKSPSQLLGFFRRNLSGALKQKSFSTASSPIVSSSNLGHSEFLESEPSTGPCQRFSSDTDSPSKGNKRRRSGSIEPLLYEPGSNAAMLRHRARDSSDMPREQSFLSTPASPQHRNPAVRVDDGISDVNLGKAQKIPLVLLRGSQDDSVIQSPRHRS